MQMLLVMSIMHISGCSDGWRNGRPGHEGASPRTRFTFDLRTLTLWTATAALVFLFIQIAARKHQWHMNHRMWPHLAAMAWVALLNAICAVACLWAMQTNGRRARLSVCVLVALGIMAASMVLPTLMGLACEKQILTGSESRYLLFSQLIHLLVIFALLPMADATNLHSGNRVSGGTKNI